MRGPASIIQRLRSEERGAVAVMTACSFGIVFATAALAVDASRFYLLKRQQQSATDLAAIAAASSIGNATAAARASLAANGRSASDLVSVDVGTYVPDPSIASRLRFTPGTSAGPNAARVTLRTVNTSFFGPVLSAIIPSASAASPQVGGTPVTDQASGTAIVTRSVAALQNSAAFVLGSRLATLDGGLLNEVLGRLLGAQLDLSVLDYQALASADVGLFGLADALALRIAPKGTTYGTLASMQVRTSDILSAAADAGAAAGMAPGAIRALREIATEIGASGSKIALGRLISFESFANLAVGSGAPITANLPLLQLVTATAKLGDSTNEVVADLAISVPSIASGKVKIVVGALPIGSSYATVGPSGTTLHTAQTRALLTLQLVGSGTITGLSLPLYVEVAPATAALSAVGCSAGTPIDPAATLAVSPGAVDGWIGDVTDAALTDTADTPTPGAALLTSIGLASVWGRAHVTVSNTAATAVPFTRAEIAAGTMKSTATTDYTASLLSGLIKDLRLSATLLGLSGSVPSGTAAAIAALLQADLVAIDGELSNVLGTLGVTVGDADTWVRAVRCGQGVLVN